MRRWRYLLGVAGLVIWVAGCGTRAAGDGRGQPSPVLGHASAGAPATGGRAAAPARTPLSGSFLMDLTWVSDQRGWALSAGPCGQGLCPRLATTTDGGRTWAALPDPPGHIQDQRGLTDCSRVACVSQVRFATATVGYLFGPALYQTSDGGRIWHRVPSRPVEALEPSAGTVARVVYDHTGCPGPCERAPRAGRLVLATGGNTGAGAFTYRLAASTDGGLDWFTAVTGTAKIDPGAPAADFLGFEDARVGRWLSDSHDILTTHDGGQRWRVQPFR